jgi:hypothetical protein
VVLNDGLSVEHTFPLAWRGIAAPAFCHNFKPREAENCDSSRRRFWPDSEREVGISSLVC